QFLGLRQASQGLFNQRIVLHVDLLSLVVPVDHRHKLEPDILPDEVSVVGKLLVRDSDIFLLQELAELLDNVIARVEILRDALVYAQVVFAEIEEWPTFGKGRTGDELFLDRGKRGLRKPDIGRNTSAAINLASAVGEPDVFARRGSIFRAVVIIVKRNIF